MEEDNDSQMGDDDYSDGIEEENNLYDDIIQYGSANAGQFSDTGSEMGDDDYSMENEDHLEETEWIEDDEESAEERVEETLRTAYENNEQINFGNGEQSNRSEQTTPLFAQRAAATATVSSRIDDDDDALSPPRTPTASKRRRNVKEGTTVPSSASNLFGVGAAENEGRSSEASLATDTRRSKQEVIKAIEKEICRLSKESTDVQWKYNTRKCSMGRDGNVEKVYTVVIPAENMLPSPSMWRHIKKTTKDEKCFLTALLFVMSAMYKPEIGSRFHTVSSMSFKKNGREHPKWTAKAELLVKKMFVEGEHFLPTPQNPGTKLSLEELLSAENFAGVRVFYFIHDSEFSATAAIRATMRGNLEDCLMQERVYGNHGMRMDFNRDNNNNNGGGGNQGNANGNNNNGNNNNGGNSSNNSGNGGRRGSNRGGRESAAGGDGLGDRKSFMKKGIWLCHKNIMTPNQLSKFVVYPLTDEPSAICGQYPQDYDIGSTALDNALNPDKWFTFQSTCGVLFERDKNGRLVSTVCNAQVNQRLYFKHKQSTNADGTTEEYISYEFPDENLVWEFNTIGFNYEELMGERDLPCSIPLLRIYLAIYEEIERENELQFNQSRGANLGIADDSVFVRFHSKNRANSRKKVDLHNTPPRGANVFTPEELQALRDMSPKVIASGRESRRYDRISNIDADRLGLNVSLKEEFNAEQLKKIGGDMLEAWVPLSESYKRVMHYKNRDYEKYKELLALLRNEGFQTFCKVYNQESDISDASKAILRWRDLKRRKRESITPEVLTAVPSLGFYNSTQIRQLLLFEADALVCNHHIVLLEIFKVVFSPYIPWRCLKLNGLPDLNIALKVLGQAEMGKSFMLDLTMNTYIPETVVKQGSETYVASYYTPFEWDVTIFYDELRMLDSLGSDSRLTPEQKQLRSKEKETITGHLVVRRVTAKKPDATGRETHVTETLTNDCDKATVNALNNLSMGDEALNTRYKLYTLMKEIRAGRSTAQMNSNLNSNNAGVKGVELKNYWRPMQYLVWAASKLIAFFVLPAPNIDILKIYTKAIIPILSMDMPSIASAVRPIERMFKLGTVEAIMYAVELYFMSEISPLKNDEEVDSEGNIMITKRKFDEKQFSGLAGHLCLPEDAAFKMIMETFMVEFFPESHHDICSYAARKLCKYRPVRPSWISKKEAEHMRADNGKPFYREQDEDVAADKTMTFNGDLNYRTPQRVSFKGDFTKLARLISTQYTVGGYSYEVVLSVLATLSKKMISYTHKEVVYDPKLGEHVSKSVLVTIPVVEFRFRKTSEGDTPEVLISMKFVDRPGEYYLRKMVAAFQHAHTRDKGPDGVSPRNILVPINNPQYPHILRTFTLEKNPKNILKIPNSYYIGKHCESVVYQNVNNNTRGLNVQNNNNNEDAEEESETENKFSKPNEGLSGPSKSNQLYQECHFDIEEYVFKQHLETCGIPLKNLPAYLPSVIDKRIYSIRTNPNGVYQDIPMPKYPIDFLKDAKMYVDKVTSFEEEGRRSGISEGDTNLKKRVEPDSFSLPDLDSLLSGSFDLDWDVGGKNDTDETGLEGEEEYIKRRKENEEENKRMATLKRHQALGGENESDKNRETSPQTPHPNSTKRVRDSASGTNKKNVKRPRPRITENDEAYVAERELLFSGRGFGREQVLYHELQTSVEGDDKEGRNDVKGAFEGSSGVREIVSRLGANEKKMANYSSSSEEDKDQESSPAPRTPSTLSAVRGKLGDNVKNRVFEKIDTAIAAAASTQSRQFVPTFLPTKEYPRVSPSASDISQESGGFDSDSSRFSLSERDYGNDSDSDLTSYEGEEESEEEEEEEEGAYDFLQRKPIRSVDALPTKGNVRSMLPVSSSSTLSLASLRSNSTKVNNSQSVASFRPTSSLVAKNKSVSYFKTKK